jgi:large subunit ribosomal protein L24
MRPKLHVRHGDTVEVIAGNARGVRGRILRVIPSKGKVVIEGVNLRWKHLRRTTQHPQGGRIEIEAPVDASNVMLLCPNRDCAKHDKPVRTRTIVGKDGKRQRACCKCGTEIPRVE